MRISYFLDTTWLRRDITGKLSNLHTRQNILNNKYYFAYYHG